MHEEMYVIHLSPFSIHIFFFQLAGIGAKRTLIKQPPAKKAQRQFERMWNVSKPSGGEDGHYGGGGMEEDEVLKEIREGGREGGR